MAKHSKVLQMANKDIKWTIGVVEVGQELVKLVDSLGQHLGALKVL